MTWRGSPCNGSTPKIARARAAMLTNREKRRRVRVDANTHGVVVAPVARGAFDLGTREPPRPGPPPGSLDLDDDDDEVPRPRLPPLFFNYRYYCILLPSPPPDVSLFTGSGTA